MGVLITILISQDALYLLSEKIDMLKNGKNIILSPNKMEFQRIKEKLNFDEKEMDILKEMDIVKETNLICNKIGNVIIIRKGKIDYICDGSENFIECDEIGSNRRCGGQGDILAGVSYIII